MTPTPALLAAEPLRVAPGQAGVVVVELRNDSDGPREHLVRAIGLDPSWSPHRVLSGAVAPGATVRIEIPVTVPKGSPAGRFPFVVTAEQRDTVTGDPLGLTLETDATVVVGDASRVLMSVVPREPSGVGGKRFSVLVENRTSEPLRLRLDSESTRNLQLRIRHPEIEVPVGGTAKVRVNAAVDRRLTGQARRIPFVLTAQGATTPVRLDATFRARPILGTMLTRTVAVLALLSIWAGLGLLAVGRISDRGKDQAATADLVAAAPKPDTGGEDGAGGDGDGSDDAGGGADDDGTPSSTALRAARRINGVVKGADPSGARITLQRTSLVSEEAQSARLVGMRLASGVGKLTAASISYESPTLSPVRATTAGPDGSWAFADVATSGYYLLTVSKPGYGTRRVVVQQRPDQALEPVEFELEAGTGKLSGTVTSLGRPVPGAQLVITDGDVSVTTTTRTTGAIGEWAVDGLSTPGSFLVTASADGLATASALVPLGAGAAGDGVDLDLARGVQSLVGTVTATSATGRTTQLGGAVVTATSTGDEPVTRSATSVTRAPDGSSAPVGSFVLPDLALGRWTITFSADGYADRTEEVVLDGATSSLQLASHLSTSGSTVRGAVTDGDGAGLVGAGLVLEGTEGTYKLTSADGGSFAVAGVVPGTYVLTAEKAGYETASVGVVAVAGGISQVEVTLPALPDAVVPETSSIRGRVVDARNGGQVRCPVENDACILVQVDDRTPVPVTPSAEYTVPGDEPGLEPGLHTVRVTAPGYEGGEATVQVPEGGVAIAPVIAVYPKPAIIGKVTPGAPAPLPPTCVVAVPSEDGPPTTAAGCSLTTTAGSPDTCAVDGGLADAVCALVDGSGNYALESLDRAGVWWVSVLPVGPIAADWIPVPAASVTLTRGETRRYDAQLDRKAQLRVLIREPGEGSGLAVPTVPVTVEAFPADSLSGAPALATVTSGVVRPDGTTDLGQALVTGLPDGRLRLIVSGTLRGQAFSAQVPLVEVGTNSTSEVTAVLTPSETNQLVGRVVWRQNSDLNGVAGIRVTVTGTTGYDGTVPQRRQVTLVTGANGCFAVTADGQPPASEVGACGSFADGAVGRLGFVTQAVDIKVDDKPGTTTSGAFEGLTTGALAGTGELVEVALKPPSRTFGGQLRIDGELPTPDQVRENVLSFAEVRVTTPAPGSGSVVITPDAEGRLSWADSTLPAGQVAPGTYTVVATAPGFDVARGNLVCGLTDQAVPDGDCTLNLSLGSWVDLVFDVSESGEPGKPVPGAIVTASGGNLPTTTLAIPPGETQVTFPDLSPAAGAITYTVRAPGFKSSGPWFRTLSATSNGPEVVTLLRLGSIEGTVLGSAGGQEAPLAGIVMTATHDHDSDTATTPVTFTSVTDAAGRYRISGTTEVDGLEGGVTWTVTADADGTGYGQTGELVKTTTIPTPTSGPRIATLPFVLTADPVTLTVNVVADNAARTPLTSAADGVVVRLTPPPPVDPLAPKVFTLTEPTTGGTFVKEGLVPTLHLLEVSAPNRAPVLTTVLLQPRLGATITIALPSRLNTLSVRVSEQVGTTTPAPLDRARVSLWTVVKDASGAVVSTTAYDPVAGADPRTTDPDGFLEFDSMPDGTYKVVVEGPVDPTTLVASPHLPVERTLKLERGQLASLDALLQLPLPKLTVSVVSGSGDPMDGATATLVAVGGGGVGQGGQRVSGGTVVFQQVVPGDYVVHTTGPGTHLAGSVAVTVGTTDQTATVTVAERQIDLTLTTDDGSTPRATITVQPASGAGLVTTYSLVVGGTVPAIYVPTGDDFTISASAAGYATDTETATAAASAVALQLVRDGSGALDITVLDGAVTPAVAAEGATVTVSGSQLVYGTGPTGSSVLVAGLAPGVHQVRVVLADGRTRTEDKTVVGNDTTAVSVTVPADAPVPVGSLGVTVKRGTTALEGAVVTVTGRATAYLTDAAGYVRIDGLDPGPVSVQATDPADGATTSARVEVSATTVTPVPLTLPALDVAQLEVTVTQDGGGGVQGAFVVVSGRSTVYTTGAGGKLLLTGLPAGRVSVQAYLNSGVSVIGTGTASTATPPPKLTLDLPAAAAGTRTLDVAVKLGTANLSGAVVTVTGLAMAYTTNGSGSVSVNGVSTGEVAVQATAPDGRILTKSVPAGTTTTAVELVFPTTTTPPAPASLTVQVRNGGAPVPEATVTVNGANGSAAATTGASGDVVLTGLPAGTYTVSATTPDYQAGSTTVTLAAGGSPTVELQVSYTGTVAVTVQQGGTGVDGATVTVVGVTPAVTGQTAGGGTVTLVKVPYGTRTITATKTTPGTGAAPDTTVSGSATVSVPAGGTASVTIVVS